jgi:hypothetical protein
MWADYLREQRRAKRRAIALMILGEVLANGHAHVVGPEGHWCATLAPVDLAHAGALLYVKLPDLPDGASASAVIYDEAATW